jgi:hypothetical protein
VDLRRPIADERRLWVRKGPELVWGENPGMVFDPATGETSFPSELPALLLQSIGQTPASYSMLLEGIAGPIDLDESGRARVLAALAFLEGAELVESLTPQTE